MLSIVAFILLIGLVNALETPVIYYTADEADNYSNMGTWGNSYDQALVSGGLTSVTGVVDNAWYCDGSDSLQINNVNPTVIKPIKTIQMWIQPRGNSNDRAFFHWSQPSNHFYGAKEGTDAASYILIDGVNVYTGNRMAALDSWVMITVSANATHTNVWYNDTLKASIASVEVLDDLGNFGLCSAQNDGLKWNGYIDNIAFFNYSFSQDDVDTTFDSGAGYDYISGTTAPVYLNISNSYPLNDIFFNYKLINYNLTVDATYPFSCGLYINDTLNYTINSTSGKDIVIDTDILMDDGVHPYYWSCNNSNYTINSTIKTFNVDTINPIIVSSNVNIVSNPYLLKTNGVINGNWTVTDNIVLYGLEALIDNVQIKNKTNLNVSEYTYNLSYSVENLSLGQHNLNISFYDGHTAKELKNPKAYNPSTSWFDDIVKFDFEVPYKQGYFKLKKKDSSIFDKWEVEEKIDRYSFKFKPKDKAETMTFYIEADSRIDVINKPDTEYGLWFVYDEHWMDFMPYTVESYNRISDTAIEVIVSGFDINQEEYTFNSIGDLNVVSESYDFFVTGFTAEYVSPIIETSDNTMNFNIYKINSSYSTDAWFNYDTVDYELNKFSSSDYDNYTVTFTTPKVSSNQEIKNFSFYYNLTDGVTFNTYNVTFNQTILRIGIDNCTGTNGTEAITFYGRDEENPDNPLIYDLNIDLDVWYEDENNYREVSFGFSGKNNYSICISDNSSSYRINSIMEYNKENYADRKYYLNNYELNNQTKNVYLYLINETKRTEVILKVYDESSGENVNDATVKIQRYYPQGNNSNDGGVYRTVEVEKTDVSGQTLSKLVLSDVFYRFIVEDSDNVVRLTTDANKVYTTTKVLPISLLTNWFETYQKIGNLQVQTECNEEDMTCKVEWNDPTNIAQEIQFEVYSRTPFGSELLFEDTATTSSGNIIYSIPYNNSGRTFEAKSYLVSNYEDDVSLLIGTDNIDSVNRVNRFGGVSTLLPITLLFISISTALLVSIGAVGVIAGSIILIIALSFIGIIHLSFQNIMIIIILGGILIAKLRQ